MRKVVEVGARDDHPPVGVLRLLAHPREEGRAVHAGQREVEEDHVGLEPRLEQVHRVLAVRRLDDEVALRLEPARDELAQLVLVLHDEHAGARLEARLAVGDDLALGGARSGRAGLGSLGHSGNLALRAAGRKRKRRNAPKSAPRPRRGTEGGRPYRPRSAR